MSRRGTMAWAQSEGVDPALVKPLRFTVPVFRWTPEAELAARLELEQSGRQNEEWRRARVRHVAWANAALVRKGLMRRDLRGKPAARAAGSKCMEMIRRAWWAHCAGKGALSRLMFAKARECWLEVSEAHDRAVGIKYSSRQGHYASAPRKISKEDRAKIRAYYERRVNEGRRQGAVKFLSGEFKVSNQTVFAILDEAPGLRVKMPRAARSEAPALSADSRRKFPDRERAQIRRRYKLFVDTGEKHGAIQRLADTFHTSGKTISKILKEEP